MHLLDISAVDDSMMIEGCNEVQLHFKLILTSGVGGEIYKIWLLRILETLSSSATRSKERRGTGVSAVCKPHVFEGSILMVGESAAESNSCSGFVLIQETSPAIRPRIIILLHCIK